ncbi:BadF/BadG/BcrA/BcrD ATPase family protein, partial [Nostoc sp. NIES-2111]
MSYVLGIDGGGSKTVCILMDDAHQVIGRGQAGAANYQSIGTEAALISIELAIHEAIKLNKPIKIDAICLGLAGVGRPKDIEIVRGLVGGLIDNQSLPITW